MSAVADPGLMILVAGPLRGGTGDDPAALAANIARMDTAALALWRAGHLPVVGEWFSIPLIEEAGSTAIGDEIYESIQHPIGVELIARCDGTLRLRGASSGADLMVDTTRAAGKPVWFTLEEIPPAEVRPIPASAGQ